MLVLTEKLEIVAEIQQLLCDLVKSMGGPANPQADGDRVNRINELFRRLQGWSNVTAEAIAPCHNANKSRSFSERVQLTIADLP